MKNKKRVLAVFGTRPEAIKMCPVVNELKADECFEVIVCVTGQHREMLDQVLDCFNIKPDYDLEIMRSEQTLFDITSTILNEIKAVYQKVEPDIVLVHGDTSTAFSAALAAFYMEIKVAHVEAGLRTYDISSPFPEEFNRQAIGIIACLHFAPTEMAKNTLIKEGKKEEYIFVTGNTSIDALKTTISTSYTNSDLEWATENNYRFVLLTAHRRENIGEPLKDIFIAIKQVLLEHKDIRILYPIHKNPIVRKIAKDIFQDSTQIRLIEPLDVIGFHNFMSKAEIILTDSGGIQEEAPALGKPVLVLRNTTERPEGVEAGVLKLVGTNQDDIYNAFSELINNGELINSMSCAANPYGDGTASKQIATILKNWKK